jgi:predicted Zn finger-like uncharacterized protein
LIIQCGACTTRYHYDEARFGSAQVKKIRCTKCSTIFEIQNPLPSAADRAPLLLADDFTLDPTEMAAEPRRRPVPRDIQSVPQSPAWDDVLATLRGPAAGAAGPPLTPMPAESRRPSAANQSTGEFPALSAGIGSDRPLKLPEWYRLSLACIAGPDSGRIFELEKPKVTIGRMNSDVVLTDTQCSRQHAVIEVSEDEAWIMDLGSTNGTFIGERRITRHALENRTEFDLGATTLMFIRTRRES